MTSLLLKPACDGCESLPRLMDEIAQRMEGPLQTLAASFYRRSDRVAETALDRLTELMRECGFQAVKGRVE